MVLIGGAKVKDKIGVLSELVRIADRVVVGGRMAYTFLAARGVALGRTHVETAWLDHANSVMREAVEHVRPCHTPARVTTRPCLFCRAIRRARLRHASAVTSCRSSRSHQSQTDQESQTIGGLCIDFGGGATQQITPHQAVLVHGNDCTVSIECAHPCRPGQPHGTSGHTQAAGS